MVPFILPPKTDHSDKPLASHRAKYTRPPPAASVPKSVTATSDSSDLIVEASSGESQALKRKATELSFKFRIPSPTLGIQKSRKRTTPIGGERSFLDMESVTSAPTSTTSSNVGYSSSAVSTGDEELRRQFRLLEGQLKRLKEERQTGRLTVVNGPTTPLPAYG